MPIIKPEARALAHPRRRRAPPGSRWRGRAPRTVAAAAPEAARKTSWRSGTPPLVEPEKGAVELQMAQRVEVTTVAFVVHGQPIVGLAEKLVVV